MNVRPKKFGKLEVEDDIFSLSIRSRLAIVLGAFVVFTLAFFPLYRQLGPTAGAFIALPMLISSWLLGFWRGFVIGLAAIVYTIVLYKSVGYASWNSIPGYMVTLIMSMSIGSMRDLGKRLKREIGDRNRVERELQGKTDELARFFSLDLDLMCIADNDGYFRRLNLAWETTLGYPLEDLEGSRFLDLVHPEDLDATLAAIAELSQGQQVRSFVNRYRSQDNTYRWIEWRASPYQNNLIYAAARDITEQVSKAEELESALEEISRAQQMLLLLSGAAQATQLATTPEEVYSAIGEAIVDLGYHAVIFRLSSRDELTLVHITIESEKLQLAEKMSGVTVQGLRLKLQPDNLQGITIGEGKGLYIERITDAILQGLPNLARPLVKRISNYPGLEQAIYAPLMVQGNPQGLLAIIGSGLRQADLTIVNTFAAQAAIALQTAQMMVELQRQTQELSGLYDTAKVISGELGIEAHLEAIAAQIHSLFAPDTLLLALYNAQVDELEIVLAIEEGQPLPTWQGQSVPLIEAGLSGWIARERQPLLIQDMEKNQLPVQPKHGARPARSWLGVPLLTQNRLVGVISVQSFKPHTFDERQQRFLEALASQIAVALDNARLYDTTKCWLNNLQVANRILTDLNRSPNIDDVFPALVTGVQELTGCDRTSLALLEPNKETAIIIAIDSQSSSLAQGATFKVSDTAAGKNVLVGKPHLTPDLSAELDYPADRILYQAGLRSRINLPLQVEGDVLGTLNLAWSSSAGYDVEQIPLLMQITHGLAMAVRKSKLFEESQRRLQLVQALREIDLAITGSVDIKLTLNVLLKQVTTQLHIDAACVLLYDEQDQSLRFAAGRGFRTKALGKTHLQLGESYAGRAALKREIVNIPDLRQHKTDFLRSPTFSQEEFLTYYGVPLLAKGKVVGVLEVFHRHPHKADAEWLDALNALAGQAAIAIDSTNLFQELQRSNIDLSLAYDATLEGWSRALELRDKETEGHTRRVTEMTLKLALALKVREADLIQIRRGALLHDIGKMGIPDSILHKPESLTDEEWKTMRKHPVYARDLLSPISYLREAMDIPYFHHEKWDGTGYPEGISGEQIPLAARIFAVVDVWDALNSDRPYRKAWPEVKVIDYIKNQSGKHFDPKVVEAFFPSVSNSDSQ